MRKRYINKKTGAIIDSLSPIKGKNWEEYTGKYTKETEATEEQQEEIVEEEIVLENMTKAELVEFAEEHKIDINQSDTKAVIIEAIAKEFEE